MQKPGTPEDYNSMTSHFDIIKNVISVHTRKVTYILKKILGNQEPIQE